MRTPIDLLKGRVNGFTKMEIARRTVPCYKNVIEPEGEQLALCLLVDHKYLYRFPFEGARGIRSLGIKARYLKGEMDDQRLREFQPGLCRYVRPREQTNSA